MLRILLAVIALTFFAGNAYAVDDATSENDAIQLDEGKQPYSPNALQHQPNNAPDAGEAREMEESDVIDN